MSILLETTKVWCCNVENAWGAVIHKKRVLGIDPGSRYTGFAVLESTSPGHWHHLTNGVFVLGEKSELAIRLAKLSCKMQEVFTEFQPQLTVIEKAFLGKNVSSAFTLGHARGVILCEAAKNQSLIREYAPRSIKKGVTGYGGADKFQMQNFLKSLLNIKHFVKDDASDAVAIALYGAREWDLEKKMKASTQNLLKSTSKPRKRKGYDL